MNIPDVPRDRIIHCDYESLDGDRKSLPVMPFIPLLLLKLQAWKDHGESLKSYMNAKQPTDVMDIKELLRLFFANRKRLLKGMGAWIPETFRQAGHARVEAFVAVHSSTRQLWKQVVF